MTRLQEMKLIAEGSERDRLELQKQLDAQRLRAATAEQRIADLMELLKRIDRTPLDRWYRDGLNVAVFAALNPNHEAESHE